MKWLFRRERADGYESADGRRVTRSTDLGVLCGFVLVAVGVLVLWDPSSPPLRAIVGLPLLFLAPGYALVSALFPQATTGRLPNGGTATDRGRRVSDAERLALSFGSSLAILPLLSLPLASVAGFSNRSVVAAVSGFVLCAAVAAWLRRRRLPPDRRYRPDLAGRLAAVRSFLFPTGSPLLAATNIALTVSVVLALTTGGYALLAPQDGERYTGMQLLSEDDSGELVAAGYPSEIEAGDSVSVTVAIENREGDDRNYELVVLQERYADGERVDREPIHRATIAVADGETDRSERTVTPTAEEGQIRLVYLLYQNGDDVPAEPTPENAYRYTHLWMTVEGETIEPDPVGDGPADDNETDSADNESGTGSGEDDSDDGTGSDDGESDDGSGDDGSGGDDGSDDGGSGGDDGSGDDGTGGDDGSGDDGGSGDGSGDDGGSDDDSSSSDGEDSDAGFPFW